MMIFKNKPKIIKIYTCVKCNTCIDHGVIINKNNKTITYISERTNKELTTNQIYTRMFGKLHHNDIRV